MPTLRSRVLATRLAASPQLHLHHIVAFLRACIWAKRAVDSRLLYSIACDIAESRARLTHDIDLQHTIEQCLCSGACGRTRSQRRIGVCFMLSRY